MKDALMGVVAVFASVGGSAAIILLCDRFPIAKLILFFALTALIVVVFFTLPSLLA